MGEEELQLRASSDLSRPDMPNKRGRFATTARVWPHSVRRQRADCLRCARSNVFVGRPRAWHFSCGPSFIAGAWGISWPTEPSRTAHLVPPRFVALAARLAYRSFGSLPALHLAE